MQPPADVLFILAPASKRTTMTAAWPVMAAVNSGVRMDGGHRLGDEVTSQTQAIQSIADITRGTNHTGTVIE